MTGIDIIDTSSDIALINKKISDLYSSYYVFDTDESTCNFNNENFVMTKNYY